MMTRRAVVYRPSIESMLLDIVVSLKKRGPHR